MSLAFGWREPRCEEGTDRLQGLGRRFELVDIADESVPHTLPDVLDPAMTRSATAVARGGDSSRIASIYSNLTRS
jgi:hypothetical protein